MLAAHLALIWAVPGTPAREVALAQRQALVIHVLAALTPQPSLAMPAAAPPSRPRAPAPHALQAAHAAPSTSLTATLPITPSAQPADEPPAPSPQPASVDTLPASTQALLPAAPAAVAAELTVVCHDRVAPAYPPEARRRGEIGLVVVRVELDERGRVAATQIERSSGHATLDQAALQAVQVWRCTPPTHDGRATRGVAVQPFNFTLGP